MQFLCGIDQLNWRWQSINTGKCLLRRRLFAVIGLLVSDGSPGPAMLTAFTRNSYSTPSSRLSTRPLHSGPVSRAFIHRGLSFSRFSIMYPVIGDPPSFKGGVHLRSMWFLSQSAASGRPGGPGSSVKWTYFLFFFFRLKFSEYQQIKKEHWH